MIFKNISIKKRGIYAIIAIVITIIFFCDSVFLKHSLLGIMSVLDITALGILFLAVAIAAGFAIVNSLFYIAAGLSLLIFLAQSYCAVPIRDINGDAALKSLLVIGFLYLIIDFCRSFHKSLKENELFKKFNSTEWSWEKVVFFILFSLFIFLFMWEIGLVVTPTTLSLCVYK